MMDITLMLWRVVGNIRVFCRIRPLIREDASIAAGSQNVLSVDTDDEDILLVSFKGRQQNFEMDRVFKPDATQQQVGNPHPYSTRSPTLPLHPTRHQ